MPGPTRILAIPGSLRRGSHSRSLIEVADRVGGPDVEIEIYADLASIPAFNEDDEGDGTPATVIDLRRRVGAADALLISTPEYNGSIPGSLKNALDWASRPYGAAEIVGKPVGLVSSSPSPFGGTWALEDLRKVIERSGGAPLGQAVSVGKVHEAGASDGVAEQIAALLTALVAATRLELEVA